MQKLTMKSKIFSYMFSIMLSSHIFYIFCDKITIYFYDNLYDYHIFLCFFSISLATSGVTNYTEKTPFKKKILSKKW